MIEVWFKDLVCDLVYDSFINRNDVILKFISLAQ